jgi:sigma-E factor negative regulatory protein RseC
MIEETGQVIAVDGLHAWVTTQRRGACGHCAQHEACGTARVAHLFEKPSAPIQVANPLQARPGDQVVIGMDEGAFLRAVILLYGIPLCGLIGGALLGQWLAQHSTILAMEPASLISGLLGLSMGLAWVRRRTRNHAQATGVAVILRYAPATMPIPTCTN